MTPDTVLVQNADEHATTCHGASKMMAVTLFMTAGAAIPAKQQVLCRIAEYDGHLLICRLPQLMTWPS